MFCAVLTVLTFIVPSAKGSNDGGNHAVKYLKFWIKITFGIYRYKGLTSVGLQLIISIIDYHQILNRLISFWFDCRLPGPPLCMSLPAMVEIPSVTPMESSICVPWRRQQRMRWNADPHPALTTRTTNAKSATKSTATRFHKIPFK